MSQRPFPKPLSAEPLPEEVWLKQVDRAEESVASHFFVAALRNMRSSVMR